jgi:arylsulfatase A-like enzyme
MKSDERLNILLITSDQQHYDTLGVTNPRLRTPALDRLCREGTRFTRAYCPNPTCSPTRASILTGQYPSTHHCWAIGVKTPEDIPTVNDDLHRAGYRSSLVGKAHFQPLASQPGTENESIECQPALHDLDFWRSFHGPWYGFDHVETARMHGDESHAGQHYALWMEEHGLANWKDYFQPWPPVKDFTRPYFNPVDRSWSLPERFHYNHWITEKTIDQIDLAARTGQPFFSWCSHFDPHPPYIVPQPWASLYNPADMQPGHFTKGEFDRMPPQFRKTREAQPDFSMYREPGGHWLHGYHSHRQAEDDLRKNMACYYGMISFMDQEIGRVLEALDARGLAENTLVVFTTDHGHFLGQHGLIAKGAFHYEDMIRVPMIARLPGRIPAGRVSDALQSLVDLAPTFLRAAGEPVPGRMQGVDQFDVWNGSADTARDHVLVENRHNPTTVHLRTYVNHRHKLTVYRNQPYGELFDLEADPQEVHNLWDEPAAAGIKARLMHAFVQAEIQREPTRMPRIAGA